MRTLKVSENKRFLVYADGEPFFYLGDTAWELFHRCTLADAEIYLKDRAAKRFTVIQAVVLGEVDGLNTPNPNGDTPLINNSPTSPNEAYFKHVDAIVAMAASLGLYIGMLPTWGDKWNKKWGAGPEVFTPENAYEYGKFLGKRYENAPIIWILGGDRPIDNDTHRNIIANMARGLREGDGAKHLISFHPMGGSTSAQHFHDTPWLDFNMWQTGHNRNRDSWNLISGDYEKAPTKPCMDSEPGYEDHAAGFDINNGYLEAYDCRKSAYWSLFAGSHGHTYGCHPIWQFYQPGRKPFTWARRPWTEAIHLPGSGQMQYARALLESRPYLTRIPGNDILVSDAGAGGKRLQATRDANGRYAFVYLPEYRPIEVDLEKLTGATTNVYWYDPRNGSSLFVGSITRNGAHQTKHTFTPPDGGPDWILCLDDAAQNYSRPGVVGRALTK